MTISQFEDVIVSGIKKTGKMVQIPSFLCFLYLSEKEDGPVKMQYLPTPPEFLMGPRETLKSKVKEMLNYNTTVKDLQGLKLSIIASGCPAMIFDGSKENSELLDEIDASFFQDTFPGLVMVFESALISKIVSFPIEDREIIPEKKIEEILEREFLVSGILRMVSPVN